MSTTTIVTIQIEWDHQAKCYRVVAFGRVGLPTRMQTVRGRAEQTSAIDLRQMRVLVGELVCALEEIPPELQF